jgi:hypothetical protein
MSGGLTIVHKARSQISLLYAWFLLAQGEYFVSVFVLIQFIVRIAPILPPAFSIPSDGAIR